MIFITKADAYLDNPFEKKWVNIIIKSSLYFGGLLLKTIEIELKGA